LAAEFTRRAKEVGHTVTEFFLDSMDIHDCKGCFGGHNSRECPCVQRDDMMQIYPAVSPLTEFNKDNWYSLVVYATVYGKDDIWFTFRNRMEIKA